MPSALSKELECKWPAHYVTCYWLTARVIQHSQHYNARLSFGAKVLRGR